MINFICNNINLNGWSAADIVVGKASAFLFVYAGIIEIYAKVMSVDGAKILDKFQIPYTFETLTQNIINRKGDDICPMEKAVQKITDPKEAFTVLYAKVYNK